jgi:hypothetical protein
LLSICFLNLHPCLALSSQTSRFTHAFPSMSTPKLTRKIHLVTLQRWQGVYFIKIRIRTFLFYICKDKICGFAEVLSPSKKLGLQIDNLQKNIGSANRKSTNCHTCGRSANITNFVSPQICGSAICGTYLRTAHLCDFEASKYTTKQIRCLGTLN